MKSPVKLINLSQNKKPIKVSVDQITVISPGEDKSDCYFKGCITFGSTHHYIFVDQTPEEIETLIND